MSLSDRKQLFIERRSDGKYALEHGGSGRAIRLFETQQEAIAYAKKHKPDESVVAERVRETEVGGRDKWRKV